MAASVMTLGIPVDDVSLDAVVRLVQKRARVGNGFGHVETIVFANAHLLVAAEDHDDVREALLAATVRVPDGVSVTLASRLGDHRLEHRYSGIDVLLRALSVPGLSHFFMGSTETVLSRIARRVETAFPRSSVAGTMAPPQWPWSPAVDDALVEKINESRASVLWVGLSAPRQELWLQRVRARLQVPVAAAIGYGFDTFAGTKPLAPPLVRRFGFEWLYRFVHHPMHTWRRVFVTGPQFFVRTLRDKRR